MADKKFALGEMHRGQEYRRRIKVVSACAGNANGEPDFTFCIVECSQEKIDEGEHYIWAETFALSNGYELPMIHFDGDEAKRWLLNRFVWESATTVNASVVNSIRKEMGGQKVND